MPVKSVFGFWCQCCVYRYSGLIDQQLHPAFHLLQTIYHKDHADGWGHKKFIRKPFIWQNIRLGMLGATLALIALGVVLYYVNINFPELNIFQDVLVLVLLFGGVFGLGVIISWGSTHIATQRFLNLRTDDLYY